LNLEHKTICMYQFINIKPLIKVEGVGDCTKCISDVFNKNCANYNPIFVRSFVNSYLLEETLFYESQKKHEKYLKKN